MKTSRRSVGILFSGGLDSAALIGLMLERGYEVWPVYVKSGLRWEDAELRAVRRFLGSIANPRLKPLRIATLALENAYRQNWSQTGRTPGVRSDDNSVFLPARNLLLLTKSLLSLYGDRVSRLAIATLKGNPFPDARPAYLKMVERILSDGFMRKVKILSPFRRSSKAAVISAARKYPLHLSTSCISPKKGLHCGRCNKCAERKAAFVRAGVADRTRYQAGTARRRVSRSS